MDATLKPSDIESQELTNTGASKRMNEDEKQALLEAVNLLIRHPGAPGLLDSMLAVANLAKVHPVQLTGEAAPLNPLIKLRNSDSTAYQRVLDLVEAKRRIAGYTPLVPPAPEPKFDKTEYMRAFMDKKRERQRRAAEIENMIRPAKDALRGRARLDFMDRQSAKWKQELDATIERARNAQGGRLSKETMDKLREQFWERVDAQLDELEQLAREEMRKPMHARLKPDASIEQLQSALEEDPYKK